MHGQQNIKIYEEVVILFIKEHSGSC